MNPCIQHNTLDVIQFNELINTSIILGRYLKEGHHHFEDFNSLLLDLFTMQYKYTIYLNTPLNRTVNDQIVEEMLTFQNLKKIRMRTVGSKANTYLAFKLILDGLFESIRGRSQLNSITDELNKINTLKSKLDYIKQLKTLIDNIDLKDLFSQDIRNELETFLNHFNHLNQTQISEKDWLNQLVQEAFDTNAAPESQELSEKLQAAIATDFQDADSAILSVLKSLNDSDNEEESLSEIENEVLKVDHETGDKNKEYIKEELEEKFAPYLKNQLLVEGQSQGQNQFASELDFSNTSDQNRIINSKSASPGTPIQTTTHQLSSQLNQHLTNHSPYRHNGEEAIRLYDISNLEESLILSEHNLKKQMAKLNLENILAKAIDDLDTFNDTTKTLGIQASSLELLTFDEVMQMHKRYKNPSFIKFVNKVGKNKLYASKIQHKKKKAHAIPIDHVVSSNNLDLLIEEEYIGLALGIEAFENDFYDRYLRDDLLTIDMIQKNDKRKGPIILCYDGSGSMEGIKIQETQSHILAIIEIAKIQKRKLILIQFASSTEPLYIKQLDPTYITAQDILDILDEFICGGTDFEKPLSKAIEFIKADHHKKSDILFITDGQCEIRESFKKKFLQLKKERAFKLYTIIMHAYTYHDYGDIGDISDEVLEIKGHDLGNWNDTTNQKLYSLI